ncbi:MAG: putative ABC transporter permease [Oscillospiraceae bacterium]
MLFGFPITLLFFYFIIYSFLGWAMETTYCSLVARHFVARGFLYGPLCPIYGVGVLLMLIFFKPFADNLVVFYVVATVTMSAWEYFVGWFLETTTHIKYWDYSKYKFNIKGRICLRVCLVWGFLSYAAIFWIHPTVEHLVGLLPDWARYSIIGVCFVLLIVDAVITIRELALITRLMAKLESVSQELQLQLALGKAELGDKFGAAKDDISGRWDAAKEDLSDRLSASWSAVGAAVPAPMNESAKKLKARYDEVLASAERRSRRFRRSYDTMSSQTFAERLEEVKTNGASLALRIKTANRARKAEKKARKAAKKQK